MAIPDPKKMRSSELALAPIRSALGPSVEAAYALQRTVSLDFDSEKRYAMAILEDPNNEYLLGCAKDNPGSLAEALLDLSRIGLSLSPVKKQAYLIPYRTKGVAKVLACPSYLGMEQAALRSGKITLIQTELVYENDEYKRWTDESGSKLTHIPARKDRGAIEGGYCLVKLENGEVRVDWMSAEEIDACEQAATRKNSGKVTPAWKYFREEMQRKCIVRRSAKHWPSDNHIELVMAQMDKADPMDFSEAEPSPEGGELCLSKQAIADIEGALGKVPVEERGVWVTMTAAAMGYPGGAENLPEGKADELRNRLLARMQRLYGEKTDA